MSDKIEKITQQIYNEGVVKAKEDAQQIINDAKTKADKIIASAKTKQEEVLAEAQKQSDDLKTKTNAELQLAARQFVSNLKLQVTNLITTEQIGKTIDSEFNNTNFVGELIQNVVKNWNPQSTDELNLKVLLPENKIGEMHTYFESKAKNTLNKGVEFEAEPKIKSGFKIGPKDGSYIISFSDKDFENYFTIYLKDRTKQMLFE